ncbi:hypothetical protein D3C73_1233970 [compost metagenome]
MPPGWWRADTSPSAGSRGWPATSAINSLEPYRPVSGTPASRARSSMLSSAGVKLAKPNSRAEAKALAGALCIMPTSASLLA